MWIMRVQRRVARFDHVPVRTHEIQGQGLTATAEAALAATGVAVVVPAMRRHEDPSQD